MRKISVVIPTLNEEENVEPLSEAIINEIEKLKEYDYEIIFIDNCSTDKTRMILAEMCRKNEKIKAIFNKRNFGGIKSPIHGILQSTGDCTIVLCADFQDPPELIPELVSKWNNGYEAVCAVKNKSKEFFLMRLVRSYFYYFVDKYSEVKQIKHFDGVGLYDRKAVEELRKLAEYDSEIQLRNIVTDLGLNYDIVEFEHQKRLHGKTKNNFPALYEYAMNILVNYTKVLFRSAIFLSVLLFILSFIVLAVTFYFNITRGFDEGFTLIYLGNLFIFLTAWPLLFIGILGEYIYNIKARIVKRQFIIEEKRINF